MGSEGKCVQWQTKTCKIMGNNFPQAFRVQCALSILCAPAFLCCHHHHELRSECFSFALRRSCCICFPLGCFAQSTPTPLHAGCSALGCFAHLPYPGFRPSHSRSCGADVFGPVCQRVGFMALCGQGGVGSDVGLRS